MIKGVSTGFITISYRSASFSVRHEEDTHLRGNSLTTHLLIPQFSTRGRKHTQGRRCITEAAAEVSAELRAYWQEAERCRGAAEVKAQRSSLWIAQKQEASGIVCMLLYFAQKNHETKCKSTGTFVDSRLTGRTKNKLHQAGFFTLFINVNRKALFNHNQCLAPSDALYLSSHKCWFTKKTTTSNSRMYRYNLKPMNPFSS